MLDTSMNTLGNRRTRKNACSIHSGRPPWGEDDAQIGKVDGHVVHGHGLAEAAARSGKMEVPVWIITGTRSRWASS